MKWVIVCVVNPPNETETQVTTFTLTFTLTSEDLTAETVEEFAVELAEEIASANLVAGEHLVLSGVTENPAAPDAA